ncbi:hypothetical protein PENTCL1PPCAC_22699 [Pristionchus entomophagus]|uniref:B box-type domain-containing protein n=1 Tax=Pristionchus entomophagus TaxID=358040 RepID=A0AAV5U2S9_9BILA|nr:hypothetical protein PENTCL1PPCAC_22699 [Pristionchus entomophagus]
MDEMESLTDGTATTSSEHFNLQMQSSVFETPPSMLARNDSYSIWGNNTAGWDSGLGQFESTHSVASDPSGLFSPSRGCTSSLPSCASCGDEAHATHFCSDCKDLLCIVCVEAHQRVRVTRDHKVIPLTSTVPKAVLPAFLMGGMEDTVPVSSLCPHHEGKLVALCEWCKCLPLCSTCFPEHMGHKITPLGNVKGVLAAIVADSREEEKKCDEVEGEIGRMMERVDSSVQGVASEVRSVMHLHVCALEERKRDLLALIETTRVSKMNGLKSQSEAMALHKSRLQQMGIMVDGVKEEDDMGTLTAIFDKLVQMYSMPRVTRHSTESDSIKFIVPDPNLLPKLRGLGGLESGACATNTQILGEGYRRAIRERHTTVTIQMRDACNQVCRSKSQQVGGSVIGPNGTPLDVTLSERDNGLVVLSYLPIHDGMHTLTVTVRGMPISGCPVQVEVRRGRNYEEISAHGELFSFGGEGTGDGQLCRPWGICCDMTGRILVADRSNNRIQMFDKDGNFLSKFGTAGTRAGQFDRPAGITTNTLNQIIVADKDNHRIQVFDQDGTFILKFGERGRPVGLFNYPWGVATNNLNHIAVSDTRNHRVQIFTSMGQFIRKCGFDSAHFYKHLDSPRGLCYLPDGQLLITDFNNHRLAVLSSSRSSPDMKCYGSEGDAEGLFCRPQGVKIDPEGHILVCDSRNNRVQIFCGEDMRCVASFGGASKTTNGFAMPTELPTPLMVGSTNTSLPPPSLFNAQTPKIRPNENLLDRPTDVCVSSEGRIYVVDFGNNCIRVF